MTPTKLLTFCSLFLLIFATSCKDDEIPDVPEQPELITTLTYTLTPEGGGDAIVLNFEDLDGDGPNAPVVQNGTLQNNTTYTGQITVTNESITPAEDITAEVAEEDKEHQFFFVTSSNNIAISYDDVDGDGNPLGLATTLTTTFAAAVPTVLTVVLRHKPTKDAENVSAGDITNAGGETDVEAEFSITVD